MNTIDHAQVLWELKDVSKYFTGISALNGVSVQFQSGEIHALIGENGSGKSTLIKCISGVHQPECGEILHNGQPIHITNPIVARKNGVATIFQEFSLIPTLTVAENIFLGRLPQNGKKLSSVSWTKMRTQALEILNSLEIAIDPAAVVNTLSVAQQQLVEIAKALSMDATLLIMDEPTAALGINEIESLHRLTRKLKAEGYGIIYISHRLDEVVDLVDRVTVLKDGKVAGTCSKEEINVKEIVRIMIGSDIENHYPKENNTMDETIFRANEISTHNGVHKATFDIRKGEVLGLAGLIGSGRTEIAKAIFGVDLLTGGTMMLNGAPLQVKRPADAISRGIAFVTENRKYDGLFMNFFAGPNITIVKLKRILNGLMLSMKKEQTAGKDYVNKLKISPLALEKLVQYLSGGNQQKVVIARWMYSEADLFIMDEPTQGIDVQAKVEVYQLINRLTSEGKSVLLISSDFPELMAMSDRLAVVHNGHIEAIVNANQITRAELMHMTLGNQSISTQSEDEQP